MKQLLELLENNARLSNSELAVMLGITENEVERMIAEYRQSGVISGYRTVIDWEKVDDSYITAQIQLKVTPSEGEGFEETARRIMQFDEVKSVYLMSGSYDIAVTVAGKSFKDVAMFVAERLSPMESITSTATCFVLRKYKEEGIPVCFKEIDERGITSL